MAHALPGQLGRRGRKFPKRLTEDYDMSVEGEFPRRCTRSSVGAATKGTVVNKTKAKGKKKASQRLGRSK